MTMGGAGSSRFNCSMETSRATGLVRGSVAGAICSEWNSVPQPLAVKRIRSVAIRVRRRLLMWLEELSGEPNNIFMSNSIMYARQSTKREKSGPLYQFASAGDSNARRSADAAAQTCMQRGGRGERWRKTVAEFDSSAAPLGATHV